MGDCLTCARTGVCGALPHSPNERRAFARMEHDCHVPLAKTREEKAGDAKVERLLAEARAAKIPCAIITREE